jgi:endoglucanase
MQYVCGTNACKTTCAANADCVSPDMCTGNTCGPPIAVSVKTKGVSNATNPPWIYFDIQLTNSGTNPITLSRITIKYWYTWDVSSGAPTENGSCTYALNLTGACGNVIESFVTLASPLSTADHAFQLGFASGAGTLATGSTIEIGPGFDKSDFSAFVETNDYSYNSNTSSFTTVTTVTVYQDGTLIYGTEPH